MPPLRLGPSPVLEAWSRESRCMVPARSWEQAGHGGAGRLVLRKFGQAVSQGACRPLGVARALGGSRLGGGRHPPCCICIRKALALLQDALLWAAPGKTQFIPLQRTWVGPWDPEGGALAVSRLETWFPLVLAMAELSLQPQIAWGYCPSYQRTG